MNFNWICSLQGCSVNKCGGGKGLNVLIIILSLVAGVSCASSRLLIMTGVPGDLVAVLQCSLLDTTSL